MTAILLQIADDVAALLNQADLSLSFTAQRLHFVRRDLQSLGSAIHVAVVPRSRETDNHSRQSVRHEPQIMVAVQRKLDQQDQSARIDELVDLTDAIEAHLRRRALPTPALAGVRWTRSELTLPYSAEDLDQQNLFLSILTLTYTAVEADAT